MGSTFAQDVWGFLFSKKSPPPAFVIMGLSRREMVENQLFLPLKIIPE
jgi:hypothetical protein